MNTTPDLADSWDSDRHYAAAAVEKEVAGRGLHSLRLSFADQHGLLRGKVLDASLTGQVLKSGVGITGSLLTKDTGHQYAFDLWKPDGGPTLAAMMGARDMVMVPDPTTFRILPWLEGTGWMQCDLYDLHGQPVELSTRRICAAAHSLLVDRGLQLQAGLEIEFHLYRLDDSAPGDHLFTHHGWDLLAEQHTDQIEPFLEPIRRDLTAIGLTPRTMEAELGPSQVELTFAPALGVEVADQAVLLRSAVKQISRRHGLHATFMSRPALPDTFPSGWHLHQSLVGIEDRSNRFAPEDPSQHLSSTGLHYLAGLLDHAAESCLLTTPTVTGYKRYRPRSVAPDRVAWSRQHRGAMLRVIDTPAGPATRIENRAGDPAANPYLYVTSQILSGLDGLKSETEPPPATQSPYDPDAGPPLPRSLGEAIQLFETSSFYRDALGDEVVDYLVTLKRAEWNRFLAAVTDWEQHEYFNLY